MKPVKRTPISKCVFAGLILVLFLATVTAQFPSQDPGHKENAVIEGISFSVPRGFNCEQSRMSRLAFMRHVKYELELFVAIPEASVDDSYLTDLSNNLVSQLFPKEKNFRWKVIPGLSDHKVSKFQTAKGNTKGYNEKLLFQTDYITIKLKDQQILVGYITQLGEFSDDPKYPGWLFNRDGPVGMSMPGWYAQAHIIASITGEKYNEINPGTVIHAVPIKKN